MNRGQRDKKSSTRETNRSKIIRELASYYGKSEFGEGECQACRLGGAKGSHLTIHGHLRDHQDLKAFGCRHNGPLKRVVMEGRGEVRLGNLPLFDRKEKEPGAGAEASRGWHVGDRHRDSYHQSDGVGDGYSDEEPGVEALRGWREGDRHGQPYDNEAGVQALKGSGEADKPYRNHTDRDEWEAGVRSPRSNSEEGLTIWENSNNRRQHLVEKSGSEPIGLSVSAVEEPRTREKTAGLKAKLSLNTGLSATPEKSTDRDRANLSMEKELFDIRNHIAEVNGSLLHISKILAIDNVEGTPQASELPVSSLISSNRSLIRIIEQTLSSSSSTKKSNVATQSSLPHLTLSTPSLLLNRGGAQTSSNFPAQSPSVVDESSLRKDLSNLRSVKSKFFELVSDLQKSQGETSQNPLVLPPKRVFESGSFARLGPVFGEERTIIGEKSDTALVENLYSDRGENPMFGEFRQPLNPSTFRSIDNSSNRSIDHLNYHDAQNADYRLKETSTLPPEELREFQHKNPSTLQYKDPSTYHPQDPSTPQYNDHPMYHPQNPSTFHPEEHTDYHPIDPPTYHPQDSPSFPIPNNPYQHPTPQPLNASTPQHLNPSGESEPERGSNSHENYSINSRPPSTPALFEGLDMETQVVPLGQSRSNSRHRISLNDPDLKNKIQTISEGSGVKIDDMKKATNISTGKLINSHSSEQIIRPTSPSIRRELSQPVYFNNASTTQPLNPNAPTAQPLIPSNSHTYFQSSHQLVSSHSDNQIFSTPSFAFPVHLPNHQTLVHSESVDTQRALNESHGSSQSLQSLQSPLAQLLNLSIPIDSLPQSVLQSLEQSLGKKGLSLCLEIGRFLRVGLSSPSKPFLAFRARSYLDSLHLLEASPPIQLALEKEIQKILERIDQETAEPHPDLQPPGRERPVGEEGDKKMKGTRSEGLALDENRDLDFMKIIYVQAKSQEKLISAKLKENE